MSIEPTPVDWEPSDDPAGCLDQPDGLQFSEDWTLSQSWQRAQTESDTGGPVNDAERMVWLDEGDPHRVVFALESDDLRTECSCDGYRYSGYCAHLYSCWWRWVRGRLVVTHLDTGRKYRFPPSWLPFDDGRRDRDLSGLTPAELDAYLACDLGDAENEERGLCEAGNRPLFQSLAVTARTASKINWPRLIANRQYIRVVPDMAEDYQRELFGAICKATFTICKDHRPDATAFISCDESGQIVTETDAPDAALTVQTRGRKHGVETIHSAQRPQQLNTTIVSQCDRRYYFRISDDNALRKLNKQAGFNVNRLPASVESGLVSPGAGLSDLENRVVVGENVTSGDILVQSTDDWTRLRRHVADDDGILDEELRI